MEHTTTKMPFHLQHLLLQNCKLFLPWPSWNNARRLFHHFLFSLLWGMCMSLVFVIDLNWFYSAAQCWEHCRTAPGLDNAFRATPPTSSHDKEEPFHLAVENWDIQTQMLSVHWQLWEGCASSCKDNTDNTEILICLKEMRIWLY